jgi:hypothetical protein
VQCESLLCWVRVWAYGLASAEQCATYSAACLGSRRAALLMQLHFVSVLQELKRGNAEAWGWSELCRGSALACCLSGLAGPVNGIDC